LNNPPKSTISWLSSSDCRSGRSRATSVHADKNNNLTHPAKTSNDFNHWQSPSHVHRRASRMPADGWFLRVMGPPVLSTVAGAILGHSRSSASLRHAKKREGIWVTGRCRQKLPAQRKTRRIGLGTIPLGNRGTGRRLAHGVLRPLTKGRGSHGREFSPLRPLRSHCAHLGCTVTWFPHQVCSCAPWTRPVSTYANGDSCLPARLRAACSTASGADKDGPASPRFPGASPTNFQPLPKKHVPRIRLNTPTQLTYDVPLAQKKLWQLVRSPRSDFSETMLADELIRGRAHEGGPMGLVVMAFPQPPVP